MDMGFSSFLWAFPIFSILIFIFSGNYFCFLDDQQQIQSTRAKTIDGLRGFLALGVFLAHSSSYYTYLIDQRWGAGPSYFYNQLGSVGVSLFFVITSYLFWGKAISVKGKITGIRRYVKYLENLYLARFFRIAPLYFSLIAALLIIVFLNTGLHLNVSLVSLVKEILNWCSLGLGAAVGINGFDEAPIIAGMVWTLGWEWYFYLSLSILTLAAFSKTLRLVIPSGMLIIVSLLGLIKYHESREYYYISLFCLGMIFACFSSRAAELQKAMLGSCLAVAVSIILVINVGAPWSTLNIILIAILFGLIERGCDIFGILNTSGAQRLGTISYGIYLTHGICLHLGFGISEIKYFALQSPLCYWLTITALAMVTTFLASVAHVWIEKPGILLGRKIQHGIDKLIAVRKSRISDPVTLSHLE